MFWVFLSGFYLVGPWQRFLSKWKIRKKRLNLDMVKFLKNWRFYNKGELVSLHGFVEADLVQKGIAMKVKVSDPEIKSK